MIAADLSHRRRPMRVYGRHARRGYRRPRAPRTRRTGVSVSHHTPSRAHQQKRLRCRQRAWSSAKHAKGVCAMGVREMNVSANVVRRAFVMKGALPRCRLLASRRAVDAADGFSPLFSRGDIDRRATRLPLLRESGGSVTIARRGTYCFRAPSAVNRRNFILREPGSAFRVCVPECPPGRPC